MSKLKRGRPTIGLKKRKRCLFSLDESVVDLFNGMFKDENRSQIVEEYMRDAIGKKGITE